MASPIHWKKCGISSHDTLRKGNGLPRRKEGFRTDSETENQIGRPSTEGSGDFDREGNRCIYGGAAIEGDGESERDGEEVG